MKSINWQAVLIAVITAVLAVLGSRQLPPQVVTVADPCPPPKQTEPAKNPLDAIGRLSMSGGYCSATPVGPLGSDGKQVLLTASHCIKAVGEACQFTTRAGRVVRCYASSINRTADAALIVTEPLLEPLPYLLVADETPAVGTAVFHAGFGIDAPGNVEKGKVLQRDTGGGQVMYWLSVSPGDSGGGICTDPQGRILSPVCCTTALARPGQVFGARPEIVRQMMSSPASFISLPPMEMPARVPMPIKE